MARTKDPHAATVKAWKTRRRATQGSGSSATQIRDEGYHIQKEPGGRAKGGKPTVGLNKEDYRGGQFLPSGDLPKKERRRRERILNDSGERQITGARSPEGITKAKPPLPGLRPLISQFMGDPEHPLTRKLVAKFPHMAAMYVKWDAGARWYNAADWLAGRDQFYDPEGNPV